MTTKTKNAKRATMDTTYKTVPGAGEVRIFPRFSAGVHGWGIHQVIDGRDPVAVTFDSGLPVFVEKHQDAIPYAEGSVALLELLAKARTATEK